MTFADTLPRHPNGYTDWSGVVTLLRGMPAETEPVDIAEDIINAAWQEGAAEAVSVLLETLALPVGRGTLVLAAEVLAAVADAGDERVVEALVERFRAARMDPFLGGAFLRSLGFLAGRNDLARADLRSLLLRLRADDDRHVLVAAARVAGHLSALESDTALDALLGRLGEHTDAAVRAEATHQLALGALGQALAASDRDALVRALLAARGAFRKVTSLEEVRPDAETFAFVVDATLSFLELPDGSPSARLGVERAAEGVENLLGASLQVDPTGLATGGEQRTLLRLARVTRTLREAARTSGTPDEWEDSYAVVVSLAQAYADVRGDVSDLITDPRVTTFFMAVAERVFAAALGPVLAGELGARQLARLRLQYERAQGDEDVAQGLRILEDAARMVGAPAPISPLIPQVERLASRVGVTAEELLQDLEAAIRERDLPGLAQRLGLAGQPALPLPVHELSRHLPEVAEVLHRVLPDLETILGEYPADRWSRLADVLAELVKYTRFARDTVPKYLRSEPAGKGQTAREADLQEDLLRSLQSAFGRRVSNEHDLIGGGRVDLMVTFENARFPIEVKHEFRYVSREHIQQNYLRQADIYAAESNRVALLMILDLRDRDLRTSGGKESDFGLYSLEDSFWVQSFRPDPQVEDARVNAVVVGLVPGNRRLPSKTTSYSQQPRPKRTRRKQADD